MSEVSLTWVCPSVRFGWPTLSRAQQEIASAVKPLVAANYVVRMAVDVPGQVRRDPDLVRDAIVRAGGFCTTDSYGRQASITVFDNRTGSVFTIMAGKGKSPDEPYDICLLGIRSEADAMVAPHRVANEILFLLTGRRFHIVRSAVRNILFTTGLAGYTIDLAPMAAALTEQYCRYEPSSIRMATVTVPMEPTGIATFNLFRTGAFTVTGLASVAAAEAAVVEILDIVARFAVPAGPAGAEPVSKPPPVSKTSTAGHKIDWNAMEARRHATQAVAIPVHRGSIRPAGPQPMGVVLRPGFPAPLVPVDDWDALFGSF